MGFATGLVMALPALCGCSGTGSAAQGGGEGHGPGVGVGAQAALQAVRRAADTLVRAGSSQAYTAMRMASGGTEITISGEGGFDYGERVGELLLTLPTGQPVPGEPVREVFTPGEVYVKNRGAGVPPDKWVRIDVVGVADGHLVTGGATDPITAAELLRGASTADDLGEAELHGEQVRHYRGVTDIAAASEAAPGVSGEQFAAAVAGEGFADTRVAFDAYFDERGRLRKVQHQFRFATARGEEVDVASMVVLYDFGSPVEVALPEEDELYSGAVT